MLGLSITLVGNLRLRFFPGIILVNGSAYFPYSRSLNVVNATIKRKLRKQDHSHNKFVILLQLQTSYKLHSIRHSGCLRYYTSTNANIMSTEIDSICRITQKAIIPCHSVVMPV